MKMKKLLKRIVDSRPTKKISRKVRKHNTRFLCDLCNYTPAVKTEPTEVNELIAERMTKAQAFAEIKSLIDGACTNIDEKLVVTKPMKSIDIYLIRVMFEEAENPYNIMTSPDVNIDAIKSIDACCVIHEPNVDNDTETK